MKYERWGSWWQSQEYKKYITPARPLQPIFMKMGARNGKPTYKPRTRLRINIQFRLRDWSAVQNEFDPN